MAQIAQSIIFIFFMLGCSVVFGNTSPCPVKDLEKCSEKMNNKTLSPEELCDGVLKDALKCYEDFRDADCTMTNETEGVVLDAIKEAKVSMEQCDKENVTPAKSTCDNTVMSTCSQALQLASTESAKNQTDQDKLCAHLNSGVNCLKGALGNCLNDGLKKSFEMILETVKSNLTELKCCDDAAIKKCISVQYTITNQTVTEKSCKTLADDKPCVVKLLDKCEGNSKQQMEASINSQTEICESHGYPGSGTATQPGLVLVLASCMALLATLI